jgi:hypothetical protein
MLISPRRHGVTEKCRTEGCWFGCAFFRRSPPLQKTQRMGHPAENIRIFQHRGRRGLVCSVILSPAFLAGRRIYGIARSTSGAGRLHRSFGAKRRRLRMTSRGTTSQTRDGGMCSYTHLHALTSCRGVPVARNRWIAKPCRASLDWTAEGGCPHMVFRYLYMSSSPRQDRQNFLAVLRHSGGILL